MASWQRTLVIMFVAQLFVAISFSIIIAFLPLYVQALGSHTGLSIEFWAGMVFSAQAVTMVIASPVWGALADRYGRKLMVERAMFGGAIMHTLMAFASSAEELVVLRAIQGLITGAISAASALVAATVPRAHTGYAMGVLQVGLWSGIAVGPLLGGVVADTWGFRTAFLVTAALLGIAGIVVFLGVEEAFEAQSERANGLFGILASWRRIIASSNVAIIYELRFMSWLGQSMILPVAPLFIASLLYGTQRVGTFTGLVFGVSSVTGIASAVYLGRLGDRIGHRRVLAASLLAAALFYVPQSLINQLWQLLILQGLAGAAIGGIMPSLSALLAHYTRPGDEGAVYGLDQSTVSAGRAIAPLVGATAAGWFGLRSTFAIVGLTFLLTGLTVVRKLPEESAD